MNRRYVINVLWSWAGVLVTLASAAVVPRLVVGHIGVVAYGLWAIAYSLVEYFWMMDFGFRAATVKLTAEYHARNEPDRVNEVINSGLLYTAVTGVLVIVGTLLFAGRIAGAYPVDATYRPVFQLLIQIVGVSWGFGMMVNIFNASLEGLQRFDVTSRIWIASTALRSIGIVTALSLGYGLEAMGWVMVAVQAFTYVWTYWAFLAAYPDFHLSTTSMTRRMLGEQFRFGLQMFPAIISSRIMGSVLPTQIAQTLSVRAVSYYSLSMKLIEYAADAIGRVGMVTGPNATQLMAENRREELVELGKNGNRYSLSVWLLLVSFLLVYRWEFYRWWMGAEIADQCSPLLPPLLLGYAAYTSQFISNSILMGLGRFGKYSWALLTETLLTLAGLAFILPTWGLLGGAWWMALMLLLNRCLFLAWLIHRELGFSLGEYVWAIYPGPLLAGTLSTGFAWWMRQALFPGLTLGSLVAAGVIHTLVYSLLAWMFCLRPAHRQAIQSILRRKLGGRQ